MSNYLHGAYGVFGSTIGENAVTGESLPVYVGTAPVNLISGYASKGLVNKPVKLYNILAKQTIGYSDDWKSFTLCEAVKAHFANSIQNIGPIYVINVLDPDTHKKSSPTSVSLTFNNGVAYIKSDTIIIDTLAIEDKSLGTDYTVSYNFETGKLAIYGSGLSGTIEATYYDVDASAVTATDVIGTSDSDTGITTGLQAIAQIYPNGGDIPNLICVPKWSETAAVYKAMVSATQKINGHWYAFALADIGLTIAEDPVKKSDVISWKSANGYDSAFSKVFWPQAYGSDGSIYHLSTLACVAFLQQDAVDETAGVPCRTCSNVSIPVKGFYFGEDSKNLGYDISSANDLNEHGITTMMQWAGNYVLWGPHTAAFEAGEDGNASADVDVLAIFDVNIRMQEYILNKFQQDHGTEIDEPMSVQMRDRILTEEQQRLDALVAIGALIGSPKVTFLDSENSTTDISNGNFHWNFYDTVTPPTKSLTAEVSYTTAGFSALLSDGEEE